MFVRVGVQVVNPEGKVNSSPATCFFAADPEHPPLVTSNAGLPDDGVAPPDVSTFMHTITHSHGAAFGFEIFTVHLSSCLKRS